MTWISSKTAPWSRNADRASARMAASLDATIAADAVEDIRNGVAALLDLAVALLRRQSERRRVIEQAGEVQPTPVQS